MCMVIKDNSILYILSATKKDEKILAFQEVWVLYRIIQVPDNANTTPCRALLMGLVRGLKDCLMCLIVVIDLL